MSAPKSPRAAAAAARVIAGEAKATVARDTGVSRATIDRHLDAMGHPTKPKRASPKAVKVEASSTPEH